MKFSITIPFPKVGRKIPIHYLTKQDTIEVLHATVVPQEGLPVATQFSFKIVNIHREVLDQKIVQLPFNASTNSYDSVPINMKYDGVNTTLIIEVIADETTSNQVVFAPIVLEVIRVEDTVKIEKRLHIQKIIVQHAALI
jgi:hypothetical protein